VDGVTNEGAQVLSLVHSRRNGSWNVMDFHIALLKSSELSFEVIGAIFQQIHWIRL
jgi:hypothetical protein